MIEVQRIGDEVVFSIRRPAIGVVFEAGEEPKFIHSLDTADDINELMEWLRADPVRWEKYGCLALVMDFIAGGAFSAPEALDALDGTNL